MGPVVNELPEIEVDLPDWWVVCHGTIVWVNDPERYPDPPPVEVVLDEVWRKGADGEDVEVLASSFDAWRAEYPEVEALLLAAVLDHAQAAAERAYEAQWER